MIKSEFHFIGICGSLRKDSYNKKLLDVAFLSVPEGVTTEIVDISAMPLYNEDVLVEGIPESVLQMKAQLTSADAIVIASPEYNYSIPGLLKNAIDWASRPPKDSPFPGKPLAILGASTGLLGTVRMQYHLRQVAVALDMYPLNRPEVMIAKAQDKFDGDGKLTDEFAIEIIRKQMSALLSLTKKLQN